MLTWSVLGVFPGPTLAGPCEAAQFYIDKFLRGWLKAGSHSNLILRF